MPPDHELDLRINTVDHTVELALSGELVDGHRELVYDLWRAEAIRDDGVPWADTLATRWRIAVDGCCERFGARIG